MQTYYSGCCGAEMKSDCEVPFCPECLKIVLHLIGADEQTIPPNAKEFKTNDLPVKKPV